MEYDEEEIAGRVEEEPTTSEVSSTWELEIDDILKQIEEDFGGVYYVIQKDGSVIKKVDKDLALINEKGIRFLKVYLRMCANKWIALSRVDQKKVDKFTLFFSDALRMSLRARKDEFEIKRHNFEPLVLNMSWFIYMALNKAVEEGERRYRRGIERRIVEFAKKGKRGITDAIMSMFKR